MKLLGIEMSLEDFDFLMCEQAKGKELKVIEGKVVAVEHEPTENEQKQARIRELKVLLLSTDYIALKAFEGSISEAEFEPIKKQREEWRKEVDTLLQQI